MRYVIDSGAQPASDISPSLKSVVSIALVDNSIRRNIAAMLTCRSIRFYEQIASCPFLSCFYLEVKPSQLVLLPDLQIIHQTRENAGLHDSCICELAFLVFNY